MIAVRLDRPWLIAELPQPMRVLSWAPQRPGFVTATRILWRQVRDADLPEDLDALAWLADETRRRGDTDAVAMLTSRDVGSFTTAKAEAEGIRATAVVTLGLSNAEAVGARIPFGTARLGTINIAVATSAPLTEAGQLEAVSIAVQARTAAVMEAGVKLATGIATGTGTDCIALACPPGDLAHAGLHTPAGEAIGAATRQAVAQAVAEWLPISTFPARP